MAALLALDSKDDLSHDMKMSIKFRTIAAPLAIYTTLLKLRSVLSYK